MRKEKKKQVIKKLIHIGKLFYEKGYLAATDGNFSGKIDSHTLVITSSGKAKYDLKEEDFMVIDLDKIKTKKKQHKEKNPIKTKEDVHQKQKPSSELHLHLEVYKKSPQAQFVFHAHPPKAIACSLVFKEKLPSSYLSEVILATGDIPIVDYARPGTKDMAEKLKPYLPEKKVLILCHHGALVWGESFEEARFGMERLEHSACILFDSFLLGKPKSLKKEEIKWLYEKRKEIGNKTL